MTGPEHYAEAERVRDALRSPHEASMNGFDGWQRDDLIALATFHATLALAATQATSLVNTPDVIRDDVTAAWLRVTQ